MLFKNTQFLGLILDSCEAYVRLLYWNLTHITFSDIETSYGLYNSGSCKLGFKLLFTTHSNTLCKRVELLFLLFFTLCINQSANKI